MNPIERRGIDAPDTNARADPKDSGNVPAGGEVDVLVQ
jgi:hypothetical protein